MDKVTDISLLDVVRSDSATKELHDNSKNWPWLNHISDDGHTWEIIDTAGEKRKTTQVSFNIELMDGTNLADAKNQEFYALAVEYAEVFRLYNPLISSLVHAQRIRALLTFICWLSEYRIKSLNQVSKEHIDSYSKHIAYGNEVALKIPNRVFDAVKQAILNSNCLPIKHGIFIRRDVYALSGTNHFPSLRQAPNHPYSSMVLGWFERNLKQDFKGIDLENIEYQDVMEEMDCIPTRVTIQDVQRKLLPMEEIWQWHHHITRSVFRYNPFPEGTGKAAKKLGILSKRTKTIPPKVAFAFLAEATKWVLEYSDVITRLYKDQVSSETAMTTLMDYGLNAVIEDGNWFFASKTRNSVTIEGLVRMLAASCFAVIAALTARRKEEIFDLGCKCIDEDRGDGAFWLTIYIEKTRQRYDLCPVPGLVKKAVSTLEALSKSPREKSDDDSIWQYTTSEGEVSSFKIAGSLQDLYDHFVLDSTGIEWSFSPHQFRRFFALIYYYRYEGAYIGALSYHLRHFNIEMTKRYITDEDFHKEMKEVGEEWTANFLRQVVSGRRKIGGKGGDKIKKKFKDWLSHFRSKVDVVEREQVVQKMVRYMNRVGANFVQHIWGTVCSCPTHTSLARLAECRNENDMPELSNGTEELCGGCPFSVYTERYAEGIERDLEARHNTQSYCQKGTILSELSGIQITSLNTLLQKAESITPLILDAEMED
ncbi:MAG: hypothetical protein ABW088_11925 [Sedimenticola sp.]